MARILVLIFLLILTNSIFSFNYYGVRATGMANAFTGLSKKDADPTSMFYNPAAVLDNKKNCYVFHPNWVGDKEMISYAKLTPANPTILGYHIIKQRVRDENGIAYELFESSITMTDVPVLDDARQDKYNILNRIKYFKGIRFAYNLKYISEKKDGDPSQKRINVDIGGLIDYSPDLTYGITFKNILSSTEKFFFPYYNIGFKYKLSQQSYCTLDIQKIRLDKSSDKEYHYGYETYLDGESKFRIGYYKEKPSRERFLTIGMTFDGGDMDWLLHWAYIKNYEHSDENSHLISFGTKF